jgi:hypothetical protein
MTPLDSVLWGKGGFEAQIPEIEEALGESIQESWNANRRQHGREVGGKLLLTERQLVFWPHRLERGEALRLIRTLATATGQPGRRVLAQEGTVWGAALDAIESLQAGGLIRGKLGVKLEDGSEEEFAVLRLKSTILPRLRAAIDAAS